MKTPLPDEELGRRVRELGRREAAGAPGLERVLRARRRGRLRPAAALAGALLAAAAAWLWPARPEPGRPVALQVETLPADDAPQAWALPSDGLLAGAGDEARAREVERLSREIEGLLRP